MATTSEDLTRVYSAEDKIWIPLPNIPKGEGWIKIIHTDPERAKQTPFGGTIAHGYYTLSLAPRFAYTLVNYEGFSFGVNYGCNRVRFPAPMPVGEKVRMRARLAAVDDIPGGVQITTELTFEREGGDKPVCVAESLARVYTGG